MEKPYEVFVPGVRETFEDWIANRGGVAVWENRNLSNPGAGLSYTPALSEAGNPSIPPHWSRCLLEVCKSIKDFRFVSAFKEVRRLPVSLRWGSQGFMLKLTDASTKKLRRALDKVGEETGQEACYRFDYDTQEAVIEVPVWSDGVGSC